MLYLFKTTEESRVDVSQRGSNIPNRYLCWSTWAAETQKQQSNDSTDRFPQRALKPGHSTSAKTWKTQLIETLRERQRSKWGHIYCVYHHFNCHNWAMQRQLMKNHWGKGEGVNSIWRGVAGNLAHCWFGVKCVKRWHISSHTGMFLLVRSDCVI